MKEFYTKYKIPILFVVVLIVAFVVYTAFFKGSDEGKDNLLTTTGGTERETPAQIVGVEITKALNQIDSLKLERAIFTDPVYNSLVDRSEEIPPEPIGKNNPFAPLTPLSNLPQVIETAGEENADEGVTIPSTPTGL